MRIVKKLIGVVLMFFGVIWFLQGINVLPGSFMTGQIRWAIYGGIAFLVGLLVLVWTSRKPRSVPPASI